MSKNFAPSKSLCNFQELYTAFQRKKPKCKYWVIKVPCLETQMTSSGWLKKDLLCLFLQRSSKFCVASRCNGLGIYIKKTWSNQLCFALSIPIKIYFRPLLHHHHSQEYFFKWNITISPYLEMLLISMIKLLFSFFISDRNV